MRKRLRILSAMVLLIVVALLINYGTKSNDANNLVAAKKLALTPGVVCGGPMFPCSLHQLATGLTIIPTPATPFTGLVGAGQRYVSPVYGTTTIRCTDVNTDPTNIGYHSYEVSATGGDNVIEWNSAGDLLSIVRMDTGTEGVVGFNPTTGCTVMNQASIGTGGAQWSYSNANVRWYKQSHSVIVHKQQFDHLNPLTAPIDTVAFNFAACPLVSGVNFTNAYVAQITTNDDDTFSITYSTDGGQQTGNWVLSYRVSTNGCSLLNTLTGSVQSSGGLGDSGQVFGVWYPFTIHSMVLAPGKGPLVIGVGSTCTGCPAIHGPFVYYVGSRQMAMSTVRVGGHATPGYAINLNTVAAPSQAYRPWGNLNDVTTLNPLPPSIKFPTPSDIHEDWNNNPGTDRTPICATQASPNQPQPLQIVSPLQAELYCVDSVTGTYIRRSSTWSTGLLVNKPNTFRTAYAIMSSDQNGDAAFATDSQGQLGNTDGKTTTCTPGTGPPTACRSDVLITLAY